MSMTEVIRTLTFKLMRLYRKKYPGTSFSCYHCNVSFHVREEVVCKVAHGRRKLNVKLYHPKCWNDMFYDFPDDDSGEPENVELAQT
jgi:hypothetical protein